MENEMKEAVLITLIVSLAVFYFCFATYSACNLEYVKERAESVWDDNGFTIIGYQGYQLDWNWPRYSTLGGAKVWYTLRRKKDTGVIYQGFLQRWGNEVHVYNIEPIIGYPVTLNKGR